jgi:homoserine/homoserine lactone efflux protein
MSRVSTSRAACHGEAGNANYDRRMNWHLFAGFLALTVVLLLTPGPIVTLVIASAARGGVRAGLTTVAGTSLGNALLLCGIALGLDWVIAHARALFEVLRWLGAAYLVWLGVRLWLSAGSRTADAGGQRVQLLRGMLVALTNPKTIAFCTAFLPQFIDPALPAARQLTVMCVTWVVLGACSDSGWAIAAGLGRAWFLSATRMRTLERVSAVALLGAGVWLSLTRRPA